MHVPMRKLALTAAAAAFALASTSGASVSAKPAPSDVRVEVLTPRGGDNAGIGGRGWIVDLAVDYPSLHAAGFSGLQLTGPAAHNNTAPFPGTFSPGRDDRLPGLVVLVSTTSAFSGPGTNLANLFNVTGVTNRDEDVAQVWDNWVVGAPLFGVDTESVLTVAVVDDLDGNGVYDDAPNVVPDANHDGRVDEDDLKQIGIASNVEEVRFRINGSA
ncbi:hypothetical protein ACGF5C_28090 [Micromonospora sp. NPDC047620]|uniref:hypothetical protein n=1 Tax=Micromonospora sp. NPDC047620 TaxID=3364251 RepID=UPI00371BA82D